MACCCKSCKTKSSAICLGRCNLPKHGCLSKENLKHGPIPKCQGWLYNAKTSPDHQLRCGWRPGHVSSSVLRKIEQHHCLKSRDCTPCQSVCRHPKPCCSHLLSLPILPSTSCCKQNPNQPLIRIIRHGGEYTICTKPSNMSNAPSGPYPLKYVLNTDTSDMNDENKDTKVRYSVEAKFNDYNFDYTSSQDSFILDFSPPEPRCIKSCSKNPCKITCFD